MNFFLILSFFLFKSILTHNNCSDCPYWKYSINKSTRFRINIVHFSGILTIHSFITINEWMHEFVIVILHIPECSALPYLQYTYFNGIIFKLQIFQTKNKIFYASCGSIGHLNYMKHKHMLIWMRGYFSNSVIHNFCFIPRRLSNDVSEFRESLSGLQIVWCIQFILLLDLFLYACRFNTKR